MEMDTIRIRHRDDIVKFTQLELANIRQHAQSILTLLCGKTLQWKERGEYQLESEFEEIESGALTELAIDSAIDFHAHFQERLKQARDDSSGSKGADHPIATPPSGAAPQADS